MKPPYVNFSKYLICLSLCYLACQTKTEQQTTSIIVEDSLEKTAKPTTDSNVAVFSKILRLQGIEYDVHAFGEGSLQTLRIITIGLTNGVDTIQQMTDPIVGAEVEDLDRDGFPELLVYTQSAGSGSYGTVLGYSPNKGKSISPIAFPELVEGSKEQKGYMGHDTFSIVASSLARRFPCYETNDVNATPTGKMRQLQYKLINGEASKQFVLVGFKDYAMPQ